MPSRPTDRRSWLRRIGDAALALILVSLGWSYGFVYIEGRSMEPTLGPGDIAIYRRHAPATVKGDLVLFEHDGDLVVHRVAGVQNDGSLRTRGDANDALDVQPVAERCVRGHVVLVIPSGQAAGRLAALLD